MSVDVKDHVSDIQNTGPMFLWTLKIMCPTFRIPSLCVWTLRIMCPTFRIPALCVCGRYGSCVRRLEYRPYVSVDVKDHVSDV